MAETSLPLPTVLENLTTPPVLPTGLQPLEHRLFVIIRDRTPGNVLMIKAHDARQDSGYQFPQVLYELDQDPCVAARRAVVAQLDCQDPEIIEVRGTRQPLKPERLPSDFAIAKSVEAICYFPVMASLRRNDMKRLINPTTTYMIWVDWREVTTMCANIRKASYERALQLFSEDGHLPTD